MIKLRLRNLIVITLILAFLNINMVVAEATLNSSDRVNDSIYEAINIVHQTSQEYPQEKIKDTDTVITKLIKPIFVTTRKESHEDIIGKKLKDSLMYTGNYNEHRKTLRQEHDLRISEVKILKNKIDSSFKTLDKFVKNQMDGSRELKKQTRKTLSYMRKYSKNSLDGIIMNYATVHEYDSVYKAVELLWSDLSDSHMNPKSLSVWESSMQKLSEDIPHTGFMKGNAHLWWLIRLSILIPLLLILLAVLIGVIKAVPYIAAEGVGIVFTMILEGFQNGLEWIADKFRR